IFDRYRAHRDLHSFPTRRSSDLSLGAAWYLPEERQIVRTEQMLDEMCATMGGRAAGKVIFNKISTGALSDLEKVNRQARAMVTRSEEHTSELQSRENLVCRLLLE